MYRLGNIPDFRAIVSAGILSDLRGKEAENHPGNRMLEKKNIVIPSRTVLVTDESARGERFQMG